MATLTWVYFYIDICKDGQKKYNICKNGFKYNRINDHHDKVGDKHYVKIYVNGYMLYYINYANVYMLYEL